MGTPSRPATDVDTLTFACAGHHKLLDHGWTTAKTRNGGTNTYHHPERLLVSGE